MQNINIQVGLSPLLKHKPIAFKKFKQIQLSFSIGQDGQIISWDNQFNPIYEMIVSLNGDHQKLSTFSLSPLRLINQEQKTYKIITIHKDSKLRIWQARDGICINVTQHTEFPQKIAGIVDNIYECRFIFPYSEETIYIFDSWTMKTIAQLSPKKQVYSHYLRGMINQNKQMILYDNYHKSYKLDVKKLFGEAFLDVGRSINNFKKSQKQLEAIIQQLKGEKLIQIYKLWSTEDEKQNLQKIQNTLKRYNEQSIPRQLFTKRLLQHYPQIQQTFTSSKVTCENLFFLKGIHLWYWLGFQNGNVIGIPATKEKNKSMILVKEQRNNHPVKYLGLVENYLAISWDNGQTKIYTMDNLMYVIQKYVINEVHEEVIKNNKIDEDDVIDKFFKIDLDLVNILKEKFSSPIKYLIPIYQIEKGRRVYQQSAFQLQNNEVVLIDCLHKKTSHFVGISQQAKIYALIYIFQYTAVATSNGIQMYGVYGFQRTIQYKNWFWEDYPFFPKLEWKHDYHNFQLENASGLDLISFANRHITSELEYTSSINDVLYETFGTIDTQNLSNEAYPQFHFIQKLQIQKSLHSRQYNSNLLVLKLKHNSYRRDLHTNTSFLLNGNFSKQLQNITNSNKRLDDQLQYQFIFYSCFMWDLFQIPHLSAMMRNIPQQFIINRRHIKQGIGKTFTILFNHQKIFSLSKFVLTQYAISAISFFQAYVMKDIEKADQMVSAVEYFTLSRKFQKIHISGQILSKSVICSNQNIVKASINLLISSIISGNLNIHPLYEYFILNMKTQEESKQKKLSQTQCSWLLYLGLGIIYGKQAIQKQQVKMLINRIIECVDLNNFIYKPDLLLVILKLVNQGLTWWKELLSKETVIKMICDLFRIYFYYDGLVNVSPQDKKFNFCFLNDSPHHIKKMKQNIIKTVVYISKEFNHQFIQCLRTQSINQKLHVAYPASVIEVLRQYLKSEKPTTHLVFYIQLLLQCLSPMTPQLRKYVQKSVLHTLQFMCTYPSISFNQPSQKLSVKTANHLYIYCLRTSTKWRTISLKDKQENIKEDAILEMSPKGTYIALLSQKLYIWRLSSGFWSGVLGAFSQGWTYQAKGSGLVWDQNQENITVLNQDPNLMKNFKL